MAHGGARNRSGPRPSETSARTERRGLKFDALPSEGFKGDPPEFPLPDALARELELWAWAWTTPQACAWIREPWRWHTVAMWVRTAVVCESWEAKAADKAGLHRFADQIGLTPAGLKENGWKIAEDELAGKREAEPSAPDAVDDVRARLTMVAGAGRG